MAEGSIKRRKPDALLSGPQGKPVTSDSTSSDRIHVGKYSAAKAVAEYRAGYAYGVLRSSASACAAEVLQQSKIPQAEVELIQRAADVLGWDRVAGWMQKPIPSLSGRIPYSLLGSEEGRKEVSAVLGRIEHGVY